MNFLFAKRIDFISDTWKSLATSACWGIQVSILQSMQPTYNDCIKEVLVSGTNYKSIHWER